MKSITVTSKHLSKTVTSKTDGAQWDVITKADGVPLISVRSEAEVIVVPANDLMSLTGESGPAEYAERDAVIQLFRRFVERTWHEFAHLINANGDVHPAYVNDAATLGRALAAIHRRYDTSFQGEDWPWPIATPPVEPIDNERKEALPI